LVKITDLSRSPLITMPLSILFPNDNKRNKYRKDNFKNYALKIIEAG